MTPSPSLAADARSEREVTLGLLPAVAFSCNCYLIIGILFAIVPAYVHLRLGLSTIAAGLVVSAQYVATVLSRPTAGRMTDVLGPKRTVLYGLVACGACGALCLLAARSEGLPVLAVALLTAGRLALGIGESLVSTGALMWGIGRVGYLHTARVISWNGIATFGAIASGAPLGVLLEQWGGLTLTGLFVMALSATAAIFALRMSSVAVARGGQMPLRHVLARVAPAGLALALGGMGFGVIAAFVTLYYAHQGWSGAALSLSVYGICFIAGRLAFANLIDRLGGFRVARTSYVVESLGLILLGLAPAPALALAGAALTGLGFSLVFPALAVEAVKTIPTPSRGTALGAYTVFVDVSLFVSGPTAGAIIGGLGYRAAFLFAALAAALALMLTVWLSALSRARSPVRR